MWSGVWCGAHICGLVDGVEIVLHEGERGVVRGI